jgi:hypothetical protein
MKQGNTELNNSNRQETMELSPNEDKDLATIRYFHSNFENFFNFWKKRGVEPDPYKGTVLKYPQKKVDGSNSPHQDFGTYDKNKSNKLTESFEQFLDESNNVKG